MSLFNPVEPQPTVPPARTPPPASPSLPAPSRSAPVVGESVRRFRRGAARRGVFSTLITPGLGAGDPAPATPARKRLLGE